VHFCSSPAIEFEIEVLERGEGLFAAGTQGGEVLIVVGFGAANGCVELVFAGFEVVGEGV
jgi:hypothetical protein